MLGMGVKLGRSASRSPMLKQIAKDAAISYGQEQICDWAGVRSPRTGVSVGGAIGEIGYKIMHPPQSVLQHKATTRGFSQSFVGDMQSGNLSSLDKFKLNNRS